MSLPINPSETEREKSPLTLYERARKFSVAPMMDITDRHFRYFLRILSNHSLLYTEMITCNSLLYGDPFGFLHHHPGESPVAVQLAGCDPRQFETCAKLCEEFGYDEINLNAGCPSPKAQDGNFGAILMKSPSLVAECVAAVRSATSLPVSVKTRLGIDGKDSPEELMEFIRVCADAGCRHFILHARKACLGNLSPKKNRTIPPIDRDTPLLVKREFPGICFVINGEIKNIGESQKLLEHFDGVMLGRSLAEDPSILIPVDRELFGAETEVVDIHDALKIYQNYMIGENSKNTPIRKLTKNLSGLLKNRKGAKNWRILVNNPPQNLTEIFEAWAFLLKEYTPA